MAAIDFSAINNAVQALNTAESQYAAADAGLTSAQGKVSAAQAALDSAQTDLVAAEKSESDVILQINAALDAVSQAALSAKIVEAVPTTTGG